MPRWLAVRARTPAGTAGDARAAARGEGESCPFYRSASDGQAKSNAGLGVDEGRVAAFLARLTVWSFGGCIPDPIGVESARLEGFVAIEAAATGATVKATSAGLVSTEIR